MAMYKCIHIIVCTYKKYLGMLSRLETVKDWSQGCQYRV